MQPKTEKAVRPADRKARFLFVAPRFHTNQVPVVRTLRARGHPVRFLARYVGAVESHAVLQPGLVPLRPPRHRAVRQLEQTQRQWPRLGALWRYLKDYRPDITIIRDFGAYTDFAVMAWLLMHRSKFLLYTQGAKYRRSFTWRQRLAARVMVRGLGGGWFTPVLYRQGPQPYTLDELDFVPLVWEPEPTLRKDWSAVQPGAPLRLLCIGKYAGYKNHPLVLRAVAHPALREQVRLTVIGECSSRQHQAEYERCQALVHELGLADRVELRTSISYEEIQREYRRHELLVLGSGSEIFWHGHFGGHGLRSAPGLGRRQRQRLLHRLGADGLCFPQRGPGFAGADVGPGRRAKVGIAGHWGAGRGNHSATVQSGSLLPGVGGRRPASSGA